MRRLLISLMLVLVLETPAIGCTIEQILELGKLGFDKDEIEAKCRPGAAINLPSAGQAPAFKLPLAGPPTLTPVAIRQGIHKSYHRGRVAPFTLITPAGETSYFIKLVDENTRKPVLTVFVKGGQTFATKAPLGSFRMVYAAGTTWYGSKHLFGPETAYAEPLTVLKFWRSGRTLNGHRIQLIKQAGGNLPEKPISAGEFGADE